MMYSPKKTKIDLFLDEQYSKISTRNKLLAVALLTLLLTGLFYIVFYQPNHEELGRLAQQASTGNEELRKVRKAARDLPVHQKALEDARIQFETTSALLPKSQEIPNLLRNISDLGRNSGLDFISFTPGQEAPKDFYAEIPIDIKIKGPYHNLGLFLDRVSKLERIVTVNNIKTEKVDQESNEMVLSSSCKLITYRFTNVTIENKKK
ncbi:type 4a pilus biogenesis protein PilO [Desulfobulbus elongatus]|uniref:type 4a pilus biogenesis protein PilO n=1 Tax=Desulfobulbus elongatus TaxID=53332 RepID=UPI000A005221|nr:type 4a pilus biogenesis protein PilO [Desulfobulbus elongatus]